MIKEIKRQRNGEKIKSVQMEISLPPACPSFNFDDLMEINIQMKGEIVNNDSNCYQNDKIIRLQVFHERQYRQFCGLHSINNLLQLTPDTRFTIEDMDNIANIMFKREQSLFSGERSTISDPNEEVDTKCFQPLCIKSLFTSKSSSLIKIKNRHMSKRFLLGSFGNYSFEVISEALRQKGYEMKPLDTSRNLLFCELEQPDTIGIIINNVHYRTVLKSQADKIDMDHSFLRLFYYYLKQYLNRIVYGCTKDEQQNIASNLVTTTRNIHTNKHNAFVKQAVGGHWFSIGKVYVNSNHLDDLNYKKNRLDSNHTPTDIENGTCSCCSPDISHHIPIIGTQNMPSTPLADEHANTSESTVTLPYPSQRAYYWFNHDSNLKQAVFIPSTKQVVDYVTKLVLERSVVCFKVSRINDFNSDGF
jgi:hypothetical protein